MRALKMTRFIKMIFPLFIAGVLTLVAIPPKRAFSASAATGQLNLMILGNYDFTALDISTLTVHSAVSNQSFARSFENRYGAGVGFGYWMMDNIAFRMMPRATCFREARPDFFSVAQLCPPPSQRD